MSPASSCNYVEFGMNLWSKTRRERGKKVVRGVGFQMISFSSLNVRCDRVYVIKTDLKWGSGVTSVSYVSIPQVTTLQTWAPRGPAMSLAGPSVQMSLGASVW